MPPLAPENVGTSLAGRKLSPNYQRANLEETFSNVPRVRKFRLKRRNYRRTD